MRYWLTTDTHFNHGMLSKTGLRPVGYEDKILSGLYKNVLNTDVLIHLGDVAWSNGWKWIRKLTDIGCTLWLVKGNHDKNSNTWFFDNGFNFVGNEFSIKYMGFNILFSHIPKPVENYDINIHGHFHNTDFRKHEPHIASILTEKHYLLALEYNNYQPWFLDNILKDFKKKSK